MPGKSFSQSAEYTGNFINANENILIRIGQKNGKFIGVLQDQYSEMMLIASANDGFLKGKLYNSFQQFECELHISGKGLVISSQGFVENFIRTDRYQKLSELELESIFVYLNSMQTVDANNFDQSYLHFNGSEEIESQDNHSLNNKKSDLNYELSKDVEIKELISGSQLVSYSRTSYVNDNTASVITYVNFCKNGRFSISYDGSFSVEGDYGDNVHGSSKGSKTGRWELIEYNGTTAVYLQFDAGFSEINPVNKERLAQGRWRVGNKQYALQRNKVFCQ
jgi:hypothetical protein